ncbi:MAG: hypothetical protein ACI8ZM_001063 [Crocinitomix sp.]|jgi:hypothetical protein
MKTLGLILFFNALFISAYTQDFEIYRVYDTEIFSGSDISGTSFDTIKAPDGTETIVYFGIRNTSGESQNIRIERSRLLHNEGTNDAFGYESNDGYSWYGYPIVSAVENFAPLVEDAHELLEGDSLWLFTYYNMGPTLGCSQYRYYILDDTNQRRDSIDVNFCPLEVSINEWSGINVNIYPNPATNIIYLAYPIELNEYVTVQITDLRGKILRTSNIESTLDLSLFAKGIYYLRIIDKSSLEAVYLERIVIN